MRCAVAVLLLTLAGLAQPPAAAPLSPPAINAAEPASYPGLHNVVAYGPGIYAGSAPEGAAGFASLNGLGVKTVLSVDGATPDLAGARAAGLRYIHLPIGYSGMDRERTLQISKAIKDAAARGPVYVHCHHGKHRAAGAAGAAMVTLGLLSNEAATAKLHISGTAPQYPGLYRCVSIAAVASPEALAAVGDEFPEVTRPAGLVEAMIGIDEAVDHLKAVEAAAWATPKDQPDLVPAAEAGRAADLFRACEEAAGERPADFRAWLKEARTAAGELETSLTAPAHDKAALSAKLKAFTRSCAACHAKYRDTEDPGHR